ncbi:MAG: LysR family transcriptional regulator [Eubacterium sp.]|nr:LysR family transcriptional regulator [Eubacterium sp.]
MQQLPVINTQQMNIFLCVVEKHGFAKAATSLHMTQSAVSKSIARLEHELEIELFHRTTRSLELTAAGKVLYEHWKKDLVSLNKSYQMALQVENENHQMLKIGVLSTARFDSYFPKLKQAFVEQAPEVNLDVAIRYVTDLIDALDNGEFDLVIIPDFVRFSAMQKGFSWQYAAVGQAYLLLGKNHPLAGRKSLKSAELKDLNFVTVHETEDYRRDLEERLSPYGCEIRVVQVYKTAYDVRYLFNSDDAGIMIDSFFDYANEFSDCVKVPIEDQRNGLICVWDPANKKEGLKKFIEILPKI